MFDSILTLSGFNTLIAQTSKFSNIGNMQTHIFNVEMSCEGCAKAITNVLNKHKDMGISNFVVDLSTTSVEIESSLGVEKLEEILKKTGKTVNYVGVKN